VGFDVRDQLLIRFLHSSDTGEKKWEYNETVHQVFVDFKEAYDLVRREVLHNIVIEFVIPMKLVRLIKMFLNETYSNFALNYAIRKAQENQVGLKSDGIHQLSVYADDVNLLADNINTIKKAHKL
jgi:hypothetical protein